MKWGAVALISLAAFYAGLIAGVFISAFGHAAKTADDQADAIERRL